MLPIILSILSFIIAGISLYMGQFRPPKIKLILGPDMHIYHPSDGGTAFYIPIIFSNKSTTRGIVEEVYLQIKTPDGKYYTFKWLEEVQITIRDWQYDHKSRAKPFTIGGNEATSKVYWFLWPTNEKELNLIEGRYYLTILASTTKGKKPRLKKMNSIIISKETATLLKERKKENDSTSRIHYFEDDTKIATLSRKEDISFFLEK